MDELKTIIKNIVADVSDHVDDESELKEVLSSLLCCIKKNNFDKNNNSLQFESWLLTEIGVSKEMLQNFKQEKIIPA